MKRLSPGLMAATIGMSAAVSILCLFAANIAPAPLSVLCLFVASLMTWIPIREEHGFLFAAVEYALVTGVTLLICRGIWTYLYIGVFGPYAFLRLFLGIHVRDRLLTVLIRLLVFNIIAAIGAAAARYLLQYDLMQFVPGFPPYLLVGAMELFFIVYMGLYHLFTYIFDSSLRNKLLPRR
ncbi:MAG: hypothetical protein IKP26_10370 [Clostridia bacterium]|nr:hypothetical protein [Clostridia bacterium]